MFREFFVEKLSNLIKIKKITNQQLANELNLTRQSISQFTKGTAMPSIEKLIAIAEKIQELKRIYEKELGLIKKESFV